MNDPPLISDDATRTVLRAFPERVRDVTIWTYDIWVTDQRAWTGRLTHRETLERLSAEGYPPAKARRKMAKARDKVLAEAGAGRWRGTRP